MLRKQNIQTNFEKKKKIIIPRTFHFYVIPAFYIDTVEGLIFYSIEIVSFIQYSHTNTRIDTDTKYIFIWKISNSNASPTVLCQQNMDNNFLSLIFMDLVEFVVFIHSKLFAECECASFQTRVINSKRKKKTVEESISWLHLNHTNTP